MIKVAQKIARTIEDLPALREGCARLVHFTDSTVAEMIAASGLDYSRQGMVSSTANVFSVIFPPVT